VEPGQDFEVVVDFVPSTPLNLQDFYGDLEKMGTSIQVGEGDGMYRMHIHVPTEKRYEPVDFIMGIGTVTKVAIENLLAQMDEVDRKGESDKIELTNIEPGQIAVVTVSPGPGISRVFASLGVAAIVEGGQTMNPSTQEILAQQQEHHPGFPTGQGCNRQGCLHRPQQNHPAGIGCHDAAQPGW
jgi:dihydroxyacetone kinase-like predicted kinase